MYKRNRERPSALPQELPRVAFSASPFRRLHLARHLHFFRFCHSSSSSQAVLQIPTMPQTPRLQHLCQRLLSFCPPQHRATDCWSVGPLFAAVYGCCACPFKWECRENLPLSLDACRLRNRCRSSNVTLPLPREALRRIDYIRSNHRSFDSGSSSRHHPLSANLQATR